MSASLYEQAISGNLAAIILWEWLYVYPFVPVEEVVAVLSMIRETV